MSVYPDAPGHRGVETSIAAAQALQPALGRLQAMTLSAIRAAGGRGLTSDEVGARTGINRYTVRARTSELLSLGLIRDSGGHRENVTGRRAIVWVAILPGGSS